MFLQSLDLTTALRPLLLPDETLLFVQDAVGLYEGKYKISDLQNGHAYLTSHRICYVDNLEPRKSSIAIELKDIEKYEFYSSLLPQAGFLKSSPKITLHPRDVKSSSGQTKNHMLVLSPQTTGSRPSRNSTASPILREYSPFTSAISGSSSPRPNNATWICPICSFSNPIPSNFDIATANMYTAIPPCLACGIKPSLAHVLKAAISSVSDRQNSPAPSLAPSQPLLESHRQNDVGSSVQNNESSEIITGPPIPGEEFQCSRCTFRNHPQLLACEICGAPLLSNGNPRKNKFGDYINRPESPGPTLDTTDSKFENSYDCIKISFRAGGDKIFHERLKGAMVQRKWLLQQAPPIPRINHSSNGLSVNKPFASQNDSNFPPERQKVVGIAGLERRGEDQRKNNEFMIGSAFEDLEALMASAKQIVALAETFAKSTTDGSSDANTLLLESATALGMVTTKDMLKSNGGSDSLYLSELSRNLAEYLTDDARGILKKEGGIMSLVDLWAVYNRARGGIDLTSPLEFEKAARLWEKLKLPVRLRQFKSGLLVVQRHDWTDDKTIAQLLAWFQEMHETPPPSDVSWDWAAFGRGVTSQETARRFGWSVGVASEELEMAEEKGVLCREEGVEGLRFWENHILDENTPVFDQESRSNKDEEEILKNLKELGLGSW